MSGASPLMRNMPSVVAAPCARMYRTQTSTTAATTGTLGSNCVVFSSSALIDAGAAFLASAAGLARYDDDENRRRLRSSSAQRDAQRNDFDRSSANLERIPRDFVIGRLATRKHVDKLVRAVAVHREVALLAAQRLGGKDEALAKLAPSRRRQTARLELVAAFLRGVAVNSGSCHRRAFLDDQLGVNSDRFVQHWS